MSERIRPGVAAQRPAPAGDGAPADVAAERSSESGPEERSDSASTGGGVRNGASGPDDDDRPLPDLPPLPADPRWRVAHLPFLTAVSAALMLCAASAGFFAGGAPAGRGAGRRGPLVGLGFTLCT